MQSNVISLCLSQLEEPNSLLQQWLAICLGKLWRKYDAARWCGVRDSAHDKLKALLWHDIPDVSDRVDGETWCSLIVIALRFEQLQCLLWGLIF